MGPRRRGRKRTGTPTRYVINFRNPGAVCYRCAPNYDFGVIIYVPSPPLSKRRHLGTRSQYTRGPFEPHSLRGPGYISYNTSYDYRATNRARGGNARARARSRPVLIPQFTSPSFRAPKPHSLSLSGPDENDEGRCEGGDPESEQSAMREGTRGAK